LRYGPTFLVCIALAAAVLHRPLAGGAPPDAAHGGEPITPIPDAAGLDSDAVALGRRLFHDPRLSRGGVNACASCHRLEEGGDDGRAIAIGADGRPLDFNAPTIFNVALNFRLNWRGNFRTLETQNAAALLDPRLMNNDWQTLLATLRADADYRRAFAAIYGGDIGREHVLDALAAYQRSLVTPDARFDRYLRGGSNAITAEEEHGYRLFKAYGCIACHQGANVGGNLFQKFGIFANPFAGRDAATRANLGRFAITRDEADRHVFRVPSLRNVALTAPYFHDGSAPSLEEAVEIMARNQLGRTLAQREVALIVAFLRTLTGERGGRPLAATVGSEGP
jgi:cytochrome c peroxidase